jgi:hypothetical protein
MGAPQTQGNGNITLSYSWVGGYVLTTPNTTVAVGQTITITLSNANTPGMQIKGMLMTATKQTGGRNGVFTFGADYQNLVRLIG